MNDIETPVTYDAELAARYQHVCDFMEAGHAFPRFADVSTAYRDWLDQQSVSQRIETALQDYPLPPEQQSAMLFFLRHWDGNADTLVQQLEQVVHQVKQMQHDFFALNSIVTDK